MMVSLEFMECAACAAKSGSPNLCVSCVHNRTVIAAQRDTLNELPRLVKIIAMAKRIAARNA